MKIAICGHGRVGKDLCAERLRDVWGFRYSGTTSRIIMPVAAKHFGISEEEAYARRHEDRETWRRIGDELRAHDPAHLARKTLENGDLCVGVRARVEMEAVIAEGLVQLVIWIDRVVPVDPTIEYGPELADVVISNHWGIDEFHRRIDRLCRVLNLGVSK